MRISTLAPIVVGCFAALCSANAFAAPVPVTVSSGDYHPSDGSTDAPWTITPANTLMWSGHPFVPAGPVFRPASLLADQASSDAAWPADAAALDTLSKHGVNQIIVDLTGGGTNALPLVAIRPESVQRLISYLDKRGFQYGIDLNAFPPSGLTGVSVDPALYRQPSPTAGSTAMIKGIDGLVDAKYMLVSTRDDSVLSSGDVTINGTSASVQVTDTGGDNTVLLVYPTRMLGSRTLEGRHCPDIWSNADRTRDDLILYLGKITFGQGLRFFLDPIRDNFGLYGTLQTGFIPNSDAYRTQFKGWLESKYSSRLAILQRDWAVTNQDLPDFETASRCIPLWNGAKGIQDLYDPVTAKQFDVYATHSNVWNDIHAFQMSTVADTMNGIAESLKHAVADVPVVYRWNTVVTAHPAGTAPGYDGLMISTAQHGDPLTAASADAVSAVSRGGRTLWLAVTELPLVSSQPKGSAPSAPATLQKDVLVADSNILTELGVRGLFTDFGANPDDSSASSLGALRSVSDNLDIEGSSLSTGAQTNLYYPENIGLLDASPRKLDAHSWWLPAVMDSKVVSLDPGVEGYTMQGPAGSEFVLYSKTDTPHQIKMQFSSMEKPIQLGLDGTVSSLPSHKGVTTLQIGPEPIILAGFPEMPVPIGAIDLEAAEVKRLIEIGDSAHAPMDSWESKLSYITGNPLISSADSAPTEFGMLLGLAGQIKTIVSPYLWIEGESPTAQSEAYEMESSDTSGGTYLWLDGSASSNDENPSADYSFICTIPGDYDVWASLGPTDDAGNYQGAPLTIAFDDGAPLTSGDARPSGDTYGSLSNLEGQTSGGFMWERLTSTHLSAGEHTLHINAVGPSASTGRASVAIDSICLDRDPFTPKGNQKPDF